MLSCQLPPSTMSTSIFPAQIGRKQRFSGHRFLCFAHSLLIQLLRRSYALPEGKNRTVWLSGLRRWLQAPVRKGVGSNPTAVMFRLCSHDGIPCSCPLVSPQSESYPSVQRYPFPGPPCLPRFHLCTRMTDNTPWAGVHSTTCGLQQHSEQRTSPT